MFKKNIVPIVVLFILSVIAAIYLLNDRKNTFTESEAGFIIEDTSKLKSIVIVNKEFSVQLQKEHGNWKVKNKYSVDHQMIDLCYRIFMQTEVSGIISSETKQEIADTIKKYGSELKLYDDNQNLLKHFFVFSNSKNHQIYMLMANSDRPYIVSLPGYSGNFAGLFKSEANWWRDKNIVGLKPNKIRSIELENFRKPNQSFRIQVDENEGPKLSNFKNNNPIQYKDELMEMYFNSFMKIKAYKYIDDNTLKDSLKKSEALYRMHIVNKIQDTTDLALYTIPGFNHSTRKNETDLNYCYVVINDVDLAVAKYIETDLVTRDLSFFVK